MKLQISALRRCTRSGGWDWAQAASPRGPLLATMGDCAYRRQKQRRPVLCILETVQPTVAQLRYETREKAECSGRLPEKGSLTGRGLAGAVFLPSQPCACFSSKPCTKARPEQPWLCFFYLLTVLLNVIGLLCHFFQFIIMGVKCYARNQTLQSLLLSLL